MKKLLALSFAVVLAGCNNDSPSPTNMQGPSGAAAATRAAQETPEPTSRPMGNTVFDVALGSKSHTTLVAAIEAADLEGSLASPGGVYTVFAPTNEAFDKLPKGTVETLLKPEKKEDLKAILQHHAAVPILQVKDFHDGQTLAMADGTKVTFHVKDGKVLVEGANILASVPAANGIVHVIDAVLLPAK
jgi:uncharacterized surface protein with fasciclin (FAS1) repeats